MTAVREPGYSDSNHKMIETATESESSELVTRYADLVDPWEDGEQHVRLKDAAIDYFGLRLEKLWSDESGKANNYHRDDIVLVFCPREPSELNAPRNEYPYLAFIESVGEMGSCRIRYGSGENQIFYEHPESAHPLDSRTGSGCSPIWRVADESLDLPMSAGLSRDTDRRA